MFTVSSTRDIYKEVIPTIVADEESWRTFLKFASNLYTRNFQNVSLIYAQRPGATMVAPFEEWKNVKRYVKKKTKGIATIKEDNGRPVINYVFDIADTGGIDIPARWQFKKEREGDILKELADDKESIKSLQDYIAKRAEEILYSANYEFMETISTLCYYSGKKIGDNPEWIYYFQDAVKNSTEYLTACRCGIDSKIHKKLYPDIGMANVSLMVFTLCDISLKAAKIVLNHIARAVTKVEMKERGLDYDKGIHAIQGNGRDPSPGDNIISRKTGGSTALRREGNQDLKAAEGETYHQLQLSFDGGNAPGSRAQAR